MEKDLIYVGGLEGGERLLDGKEHSRNYRQGYRVYDSLGIANAITANGGGIGGPTGLYLVREETTAPKCLKIGLTGGVGAGKSTVLRYIESSYNCLVLVTDMIAYNIIRHNEDCLAEVEEIFKEDDIHDSNGDIDSAKVGKIIFSDDDKKQRMNHAVHPRVIDFVEKEYEKAVAEGKYDFVLIESALLIECGIAESCDEVWYVSAPEEVRIKRLRSGRHYSRAKCLGIIKGQMHDEEFRKCATAIIDTGVSHEETYRAVDQIIKALGISKIQKDNLYDDAYSAIIGGLSE